MGRVGTRHGSWRSTAAGRGGAVSANGVGALLVRQRSILSLFLLAHTVAPAENPTCLPQERPVLFSDNRSTFTSIRPVDGALFELKESDAKLQNMSFQEFNSHNK